MASTMTPLLKSCDGVLLPERHDMTMCENWKNSAIRLKYFFQPNDPKETWSMIGSLLHVLFTSVHLYWGKIVHLQDTLTKKTDVYNRPTTYIETDSD